MSSSLDWTSAPSDPQGALVYEWRRYGDPAPDIGILRVGDRVQFSFHKDANAPLWLNRSWATVTRVGRSRVWVKADLEGYGEDELGRWLGPNGIGRVVRPGEAAQ